MTKLNDAEEMRIVLLRSARVDGVWRAGGWSGPVRAEEAQQLIDRGWATVAERTKDAGRKR